MKTKDEIVAALLAGRIITSEQIKENFAFTTNAEARKFMEKLERELFEEGIPLTSSFCGYYVPQSKEQAIEGLIFLRKKAMSILKRYNQRLKMYKQKFPELEQYQLILEEENK